jgi:hypothetical protein
MSRIPAREALLASGAVSVVVSLCLLGAVTAGTPAVAKTEDGTINAGTSGSQLGSDPTGGAAGPLRVTDDVAQSLPAAVASALGEGRSGGGDSVIDAGSSAGLDAVRSRATLAAIEAQAAADAAAQAAAQAAAAKAKAAAKPSATSVPKPAPVYTQSRSAALAAVSGSPVAIAQALAAARGWTGDQWVCLDNLWSHESHFETGARNGQSGAYGIPQALPASKMATAGADWRTNPVTQIQWGLGYIADRYGTPCGAWSYWLRHYSY